MALERQLGFEPVDREADRLGYDLESRDPRTGRLRFIKVKGRVAGTGTITVTKNEILYSLNQPDNGHRVYYVHQPFRREPDFGVTSVNYALTELLAQGKLMTVSQVHADDGIE